jgi:hypothetical protein
MRHENQRIESVSRYFCESAKLLGLLVDLIGIEPMTSSMPWKRAPSCATGPQPQWDNSPIFAASGRFVKLPAFPGEIAEQLSDFSCDDREHSWRGRCQKE